MGIDNIDRKIEKKPGNDKITEFVIKFLTLFDCIEI